VAIPEDLCDGSNRCHDRGGTKISDITRKVTIGSFLWTVARNVAGLTTLIASLASSVKGTTIGCSAIARNVTKLAASIALHGLSLTISGEVVGSSALVASSGTGSTSKSSTGCESSTISTSRGTDTTASTRNGTRSSWAGARTSQMSWLTTVVATTAGASATETQSWAVCLDVA